MNKFIVALALGAAAVSRSLCAAEKPERPIPAIERVVIISIDGLRPDRLLLANTPVLHAMIHEGAYTFWARTTAVSITLPSHTSMLTGVTPQKHGIEWNYDLPLRVPVYPRVPTIFELAHKCGYTTAMVAGKSKFSALAKPGTLDEVFVPEQDCDTDAQVADEAVKVILGAKPELLFVHFPVVDQMGHAHGWGSPEQLAAIGRADTAVGRVIAALEQAGVKEHTLVIVTADHGGAGRGHGADDPRSRHIPWIATGPGIKPGDLTQFAELEVRTEDTAATACYVLGLGQFPYFDGKPVLLAFENAPKK
jgi:arylsulfatase A-like enzyme